MDNIIRLKDGLEFEVEIPDGSYQEISNNSNLEKSLEGLKLLLRNVAVTVDEGLQGVNEKVKTDEVSVSLGVKVGIDGNFFIAKTSTEAHIRVEFKLGKTNG